MEHELSVCILSQIYSLAKVTIKMHALIVCVPSQLLVPVLLLQSLLTQVFFLLKFKPFKQG